MVNAEQLLKRFKIRVNHYVITNDNDIAIKFIVSGGAEVIDEAHTIETIKDMIIEHGAGRDTTKIIDGQRLPFKYTTTPFDYTKLEELAKYKSIKSLSKDEALKINKDIKSKEELEDKLVYITDKEPSTNSLALAKQFNLKHMAVIEKLFELGSMYPSILMKIKNDVYKDKVKAGGGRVPKNSGLDPIEYSIGIKYIDNYQPFYHIPEDVYYQFVKKIGTPKGLNTQHGMEKLIFIEEKQDEYFNAFKKVRSYLHDTDTKSKELDAIIKTRTKNTADLMSSIYDFVTKYNSYHTDKQLNIVNASKLIFNVVNHTNNINAINYIPPTDEELKSNKTRKTREEELQELLARTEFKFIGALDIASKHHLPLHEVVTSVINKTETELLEILKEYNSESLFELTK